MDRVKWKAEQFRVAAPVGYKSCKTCPRYLLTTDCHARCERCRAGNKDTYAGRSCAECGKPYVARTVTQATCGKSCARKRGARLLRERRRAS